MKVKRGIFVLMAVTVLLAFKAEKKPVIYMIGDSTMANKVLEKEGPERGWGQMLPGYFSSDVVIDNHAKNGRSSKSFRGEGLWDKVIAQVGEGDYVFIQFGHNDQKIKAPERYSDPKGEFRENLRRYVRETRAKGGIPVLFTSIARRHFSGDTLIDTHGEWITATKAVAEEERVPLIDLNRSTTEWLKATGDEASREYFMWVAPMTCPQCPKGKEDNTHLKAAGARLVARLAVDEMKEKIPALAKYVRYYDYVVAQDGSGDFFTVREAIDAIPSFRKQETTVFIRNGVYKERLLLPADKDRVTFIGEDAEKTILLSDDYARKKNCFGEEMGTSGSAGFYIYGNDFTAQNLTFENSAGRVGQAVAVLTMGDRMTFRKCRFLGNQDTFYTKAESSRVYCEDCYIEGTVDFIFGKSVAVFNRCTVHSKADAYITAAATPQEQEYGYLFYDCRLTAAPDVKTVYLGRPWRPCAKVAFVNCEMGKHICPPGWHNWSRPEAEKTTEYIEINNRGEGANLAGRVSWMKKPAKKKIYTPQAYLKGSDGFNPVK